MWYNDLKQFEKAYETYLVNREERVFGKKGKKKMKKVKKFKKKN